MHIKLPTGAIIPGSGIMGNFHFINYMISITFGLFKVSVIIVLSLKIIFFKLGEYRLQYLWRE